MLHSQLRLGGSEGQRKSGFLLVPAKHRRRQDLTHVPLSSSTMAEPFCLIRPHSTITVRNRPRTGHFKAAAIYAAVTPRRRVRCFFEQAIDREESANRVVDFGTSSVLMGRNGWKTHGPRRSGTGPAMAAK